MKLKFILLLFLFSLQKNYSQSKEYKYFYIELYNDDAFSEKKLDDKMINLYTSENDKITQVEKNLFKIEPNNELKTITLRIADKSISINLERHNENKFFDISIFLPTNSGGQIFQIKRGDVITIQKNCNSEVCDIISVDFPQIIVVNKEIHIKGNEIFQKYIFD